NRLVQQVRNCSRVKWTFVVPRRMEEGGKGGRREDASGEKGCSGDKALKWNTAMTGEKETGSPSHPPGGHAQKKTFCRICEMHCGLRVDFDAQGAITSLRPDREHPVSQGY